MPSVPKLVSERTVGEGTEEGLVVNIARKATPGAVKSRFSTAE